MRSNRHAWSDLGVLRQEDEVLGLHVAVKDVVCVAKHQCAHDLRKSYELYTSEGEPCQGRRQKPCTRGPHVPS